MIHLIVSALSHLFPGALGTFLRQLAAALRAGGL
jgi:hypothetical protein